MTLPPGYLATSTQASGVPEHVQDAATLATIRARIRLSS